MGELCYTMERMLARESGWAGLVMMMLKFQLDLMFKSAFLFNDDHVCSDHLDVMCKRTCRP